MAPGRRNIPPPYDHILLADEVRYLHSLWHQAATRSNPNPNIHAISSSADPFKKQTKKKKNNEETEIPPSPAIPWPAPSPDPLHDETIGKWPSWPIKQTTTTTPRNGTSTTSAEANAAVRFQRNGLRASADFLSKKSTSDSDSCEDDEEKESFEFFRELFKKDGELRGYYRKNYEKGEFWCLVCGGTGVKVWRKYGDCVGVVQHSNGISKTARRAAHRGYGRAVCRVLGWDATRLPSIVLDPNRDDDDDADAGTD
ncbi:putative protein phosphatase 2C F42G9.1 [Iris pallida]|uniref:Uncharacterized protein n=1 Tax=Iris pallida TaxID=29817 RepID=A0AAX6GXX8_IRIPA|nr:putative protein phosphatase 2C F42G9.1 [Iris pallida]